MKKIWGLQISAAPTEEELRRLFPLSEEIPAQFRLQNLTVQNFYLIDGQLKQWNGPMISVNSPIFLRDKDENLAPVIIGEYPSLSGQEALEVLDAAVRAYGNGEGDWPTMPVEKRCEYLRTFATRMTEVREEVVRLLMWEIGKTLPDAGKEFDRTVAYIHDTVKATLELSHNSSALVHEGNIVAQVRRAPLGVVLCMGPFNYPLNETFTTLIPALIMGNTVVMKPPKLGVLLLSPLLKIFQEVFPPGVINTVYGDGQTVVGPMMTSGKVDVLAFIGTSKVADILKKMSPKPHRMRSILGLEAKNPAIILPNADMEITVKECLAGSLTYNGQRCTAIKIIFVHRSRAEEFTTKFTKAVDGLQIGMPWDEKVNITPLPEENKASWMNELIQDALSKGAELLNVCGGEFLESLMVPAIVFPVKDGMRLYTEEQFGPIVPIAVYDDLEEVMHYIRTSDYGQQASVFGGNAMTLGKLIDVLTNQVCRVNINCQCQRGPDIFPFTGRKDSAEATLSVSDALRAFSIRSMVSTNADPDGLATFQVIRDEGLSEFLSIK